MDIVWNKRDDDHDEYITRQQNPQPFKKIISPLDSKILALFVCYKEISTQLTNAAAYCRIDTTQRNTTCIPHDNIINDVV